MMVSGWLVCLGAGPKGSVLSRAGQCLKSHSKPLTNEFLVHTIVQCYIALSLRAQTVLRGVVAPCYQHHKVLQLHATQSEPLDYIALN